MEKASKEQLASDLRDVLDDVEQLMRQAASAGEEQAAELRHRAASAVERAQDKLDLMRRDQARERREDDMANLSREEMQAELKFLIADSNARFEKTMGEIKEDRATAKASQAMLDQKLSTLSEKMTQFGSTLAKNEERVISENKTTRLTVIVTAIATVVGIIGGLATVNSAFKSFFDAGVDHAGLVRRVENLETAKKPESSQSTGERGDTRKN